MSIARLAYSVVIPAFDAAATLGEAIASVAGQTVPPAEILVVDDGSRDDTAALAAQAHPLVRVIVQANAGPGAATTRGMGECRQALIATLDADDVWLPAKMERQLSHMAAEQAADGVFSDLELFGEGQVGGQVHAGWVRSTMVVRRHVFERVGAIIDPPGHRGEMIDWLARAREAGFRLDLLSEVLVRRRVAPGSLSHGRDALKDRGYLHVARERILRMRRAGASSA
jgi:glycosyltransferase involved in cell wall biosynthesis